MGLDDREAEPEPGAAGLPRRPPRRLHGTVPVGYGSAFAGATGTFMADCKLLPDAGPGFVALANGGWTEVGAALQEVFSQVV